jgi:hypothetical protein
MCLSSHCLETALVYLLISQSLHSNGSTCYNIFQELFPSCTQNLMLTHSIIWFLMACNTQCTKHVHMKQQCSPSWLQLAGLPGSHFNMRPALLAEQYSCCIFLFCFSIIIFLPFCLCKHSFLFYSVIFILDFTDSSMTPDVEDLVLQLFELVNEKNELFRRQAELMYL